MRFYQCSDPNIDKRMHKTTDGYLNMSHKDMYLWKLEKKKGNICKKSTHL